MRYRSQRKVAPELVADLRQVAMGRPRFGYRRLHVMLKRMGWTVNRKLTHLDARIAVGSAAQALGKA